MNERARRALYEMKSDLDSKRISSADFYMNIANNAVFADADLSCDLDSSNPDQKLLEVIEGENKVLYQIPVDDEQYSKIREAGCEEI